MIVAMAAVAPLLMVQCQDAAPDPWFVDVTEKTGITFSRVNGVTGQHRYLESVGGGLALFDYDGDGWLDIYLVNGNEFLKPPSPKTTNHLYRNNHDGTFTDVTQEAGVGDAGFGQGCCAADFDNDGDQDLYVSNWGPDRFYRNDGKGRFTEVGASIGVVNDRFGQCCGFFDFDGDGWLDLYVQNYVEYDPAKEPPRPDYAAPTAFPGAPDLLFRNNGDGTFTDVTKAVGIHRGDGRGMGLVCADLDGDGDSDVFVANDAMENFYFENNGNGTFTEQSIRSGLAYNHQGDSESSMGADLGDVDGDGKPDIVCPALRAEGCTLYGNLGESFEDVSRRARLADATRDYTGFSPNLIDFDNDGDLDLFVCNGGVANNLGVKPGATYLERYGIVDVLMINDGEGGFRRAGELAGPYFGKSMIGRGSAHGDLDNDGDIDIVVVNLVGAPVVLRNDAPQGNWITLTLEMADGNRDAIGTKIRVTAAGRTQSSIVRGAGSYLSVHDRRPHFGIGAATRVDRINIVWPNGEKQTLADVEANRFVAVKQK
jgi:enediyne biosynthesis protein E4